MNVITLLNEKGGVGKTTLATHIAAGLAIKGYRVVLVDADPQGNATSAMGLPRKPHLYNLAVRNDPWQNVLSLVHPDVFGERDNAPAGQLFMVAGNVETRNVANTISDNTVFIHRFNELRQSVHFIVVDTSPTPSLLHASIMAASDYILIPTQCETDSADGVAQSVFHTQRVRQVAQAQGLNTAQIMGIIPMMFRPNTIAHNAVLDQLKEDYGALVWNPVQMLIAFAESRIINECMYGYAGDSAGTKMLWQIVNRILRVTVSHEQA